MIDKILIRLIAWSTCTWINRASGYEKVNRAIKIKNGINDYLKACAEELNDY